MKYGEALQRDSEPKWAPYNIDYNELKNIIKEQTKQDEGRAIAIPGQVNASLKEFEESFFNELYNQHDRVDLFVKSKSSEIDRRLKTHEKQVIRLLQRSAYSDGQSMTHSQREKLAKFDRQISRCGEEIISLQRFVDAQRTAFRKILKKYRKWTGSNAVEERFKDEVLGSEKSFTRRNFEPLLSQQKNLLTTIRQSTPDSSVPTTPRSVTRSVASLRSSSQSEVQREPQSYWNEYDHGSEAGEDEPYTIYVNPGEDSIFPGAKRVANLLSAPMGKVRGWLSPQPSPGERRPLLENRDPNVNGNGNSGYFTEQTETDLDEEAYESSTDIPSGGYSTHYSKFPSVNDQKYARYREQLLFRGMIGSFAAAFTLLLIASLLLATGKHKLLVEVDAGAIVGIVSSLFFAALALGMTLCTTEPLSWLRRSCVGVTFIALCALNGMLLVLVVGNGGL